MGFSGAKGFHQALYVLYVFSYKVPDPCATLLPLKRPATPQHLEKARIQTEKSYDELSRATEVAILMYIAKQHLYICKDEGCLCRHSPAR
jgi:hypothetical protein